MRLRTLVGLAVVMMVGLAGCGQENTTETQTVSAEVSTTTVAPSVPATVVTPSGAFVADDDTSDPNSDLAGQNFDAPVSDGDELAVVGVAYDDVLNIRSAPGTTNAVVATLAPLDDVIATGRARLLPNSIWYEVTAPTGTTGWAGSAFLAFRGAMREATQEVQAMPEAMKGSLDEIGDAVASIYAGDDESVRVSQTTPDEAGRRTIDVVGIPDDSVAGYRLTVRTAASAEGTEQLTTSLEKTVLCRRGISDGICL